jgi:DNA-binding beta-propeller fold protein YncE
MVLFSACTVESSGLTIANSRVQGLKASAASFDVIAIDQSTHRLYAADRSLGGVDVFDVTKPPGTYMQTIALPSPPNGLAVAPDIGRVFAGLATGSVAIIDAVPTSPSYATVIKAVFSGGSSVDLIDYSAEKHRVYASNGAEGTVASIDANTGDVTARFKVGGVLEQPVFNPHDGMLYVTSADAGALFQLDADSGAVKGKIALPACTPRGAAISAKLNVALIACTGGVLRLNLGATSDMKMFSQITDGDIVSYDPAAERFFVATPGSPTPGGRVGSEVGLFGGDPVEYVTAVDTGAGGNSAAYDEANQVVYTPDVRAGRAGLASFKMPAGEAPLSVSPSAVGVFAALIVVIVVVMFAIGRMADPIRRPEPLPSRRRA